MQPSAYITEVFTSIQGEGPNLGRCHRFVRLETCDADCAYCDTPDSLVKNPTCRVEHEPFRATFDEISNPVEADALGAALARLNRSDVLCDGLVLTGGEPLMQADFIAHCGRNGLLEPTPVILETDGNLPGPLQKVMDFVDVVAIDIKIPSATGERAKFDVNREFLMIAAHKGCYVKVVYGAHTPPEEIAIAAQLVAAVRSDIPFVLQPVIPARNATEAPLPRLALDLHATARKILPDVRVIPQAHRHLELP